MKGTTWIPKDKGKVLDAAFGGSHIRDAAVVFDLIGGFCS